MKRLVLLFFGFLFMVNQGYGSSGDLPYGYPESDREITKINQGWRFHLGDPDEAFYKKEFDDSEWEVVSVPHTLKLTSLNLDGVLDDKTQPTFHRTVGWYRKSLSVTKDADKKVFLEFEGAHQVTDLWVNGKHVGQHAIGGYTPFVFDISDFVTYGEKNQITLLVDNRRREDVPPDPGPFDYIKFSGLYRDVYLVETNDLRISFDIEGANSGISITTPSVDPVNRNATITIKTGLMNDGTSNRDVTVVNRVVDADGIVVMKLVSEVRVPPGAASQVLQTGGIENNARMWSVDDPYLYKVNTMVVEDGSVVDCVDNTLGLRTFELDPEKGFMLNGKPIELIGFNRHQHYGYIGDALPNSLHYKDMLQFKKMGFNVMRTAHYPQDDALIEACDELGILVYEEAPTWINMTPNQKWFDNLESAARTMVRNHRNHPSVVIWGAGINHRGYVPQIQYAIKEEDPTRLTASQSSRWTGWQTSGVTDVYANMNYGPVIWGRNEPLFAMEGRYGPETIAKYKRDPMMPGMISWTAHAYYTFHDIGKWDDRTRSGVWDSFRYPKEQFLWWYPAELTDLPVVHIVDDWTPDIRELTVYSNCSEIEVFINDRSMGKYCPSRALKYQGLDHPPFHVAIDRFEKGSLTVKGYIEGEIVKEETIYTPLEPSQIRLKVDTIGRNFVANDADILVGYAEVIDKNGMVIKNSDFEISFSIKGDAQIVGGNADIGANPVKAHNGVAPVLIKAGDTPDEIQIKATADGLKPASFSVRSIPSETNMIVANAYAIHDYIETKVDMGGDGQLVQFGWHPWYGQDDEESVFAIPEFEGAKAEVKTASAEGVLRWMGEMNVIGQFGFVYGEGVFGSDKQGVVLEFTGLPEGKYRLKTYHHAPRSNTDSMDPNLERLKNETIHKLPYAKVIQAEVLGRKGNVIINNIEVSEGKELQFDKPGIETFDFTADGDNPVKIIFKSQKGPKGVWLNGFELRKWK